VTRSKTEWESQFREWAEGPGDSETARCENAERMIRKALNGGRELQGLEIEVFSQGSFKNLTNIPQESDVDISACLKSTFYYKVPDGADPKNFGLTNPSDYEYSTYRRSVTNALTEHFGAKDVSVGKKAIRIHSNTYRVDADVVPNWLYREYFDSGYVREGIKFNSTDGRVIVNYPKQHIEQGIIKNSKTAKRFKRLARVMKSLQVEMLDDKKVDEQLPSFLLESVVYNAPDDRFGQSSYFDDVQEVLRFVYLNTRPEDDASKWVEVNDVKYLFHSTQPWTKAQANAFVLAAWRYVGLFT
jgi:hypothetical protein